METTMMLYILIERISWGSKNLEVTMGFNSNKIIHDLDDSG